MKLPRGSFVRIEKPELQAVITRLRELGYRTVGPQVADGAVVYGELESISQLPIGWIDEQDGGRYRLVDDGGVQAWFDFVVGPHSLKQFLFPPQETVLECERQGDRWSMREADVSAPPLAVIGPRSCDLHAMQVHDRIFLQGAYVDVAYQARRESLFALAVNCRRAAATCFCHSMKTGPAATSGFDLALTELDDCFIIEVGTDQGGRVIRSADWTPSSIEDIHTAQALPRQLAERMHERSSVPHAAHSEGSSASQPDSAGTRQRQLDTTGIHDVLMSNLEHPRWADVAQRCLACANCTLVCPTCFCSAVEDVTDLTGDHVRRERRWASCFTAEHSYMNSGSVRKTTASRYRQWLTHKLATWIDQYGVSGCVGCGRCITWCPVGIDLTEEVAVLRGESS